MKRYSNIEDEFKKLKASFPKSLENDIEDLLLLIKINSRHKVSWGYGS